MLDVRFVVERFTSSLLLFLGVLERFISSVSVWPLCSWLNYEVVILQDSKVKLVAYFSICNVNSACKRNLVMHLNGKKHAQNMKVDSDSGESSYYSDSESDYWWRCVSCWWSPSPLIICLFFLLQKWGTVKDHLHLGWSHSYHFLCKIYRILQGWLGRITSEEDWGTEESGIKYTTAVILQV